MASSPGTDDQLPDPVPATGSPLLDIRRGISLDLGLPVDVPSMDMQERESENLMRQQSLGTMRREAGAFYSEFRRKMAELEQFVHKEVKHLQQVADEAEKFGYGLHPTRSAAPDFVFGPGGPISERSKGSKNSAHKWLFGRNEQGEAGENGAHNNRGVSGWMAEHLHVFGENHPKLFGRLGSGLGIGTTDFDDDKPNSRQAKTMQEVVNRIGSSHCLSVDNSVFGIQQRLKKDVAFQQVALDGFMSIFIVLNSITIGLSSDVHPDWAGWDVMDVVFALIFFLELVTKICLIRVRGYFLGDDRLWNIFEAVLVVMGLMQAGIIIFDEGSSDSGTSFGLFRIIRLARITRLIRVCRLQVFGQLMVMIRGAIGGMKTLGWATLLVCSPLYGLAIFFRETLGRFADEGHGAELFSTVPHSFFTLFRCLVSGECTDMSGRPLIAVLSRHYGWTYGAVFCSFEVLLSFGLFNVIVAIFIEHVLARTKTNESSLKRERLRDKQFFANKMAELCEVIAEKKEAQRAVFPGPKALLMSVQNVELTPDCFEELRTDPRVVEIFHDLAISDEDTLHMFETLDTDGSGTIDISELFEGIAKLRGEARRSDVVALNFLIKKVVDDVQAMDKRLDKVIKKLLKQKSNGSQRSIDASDSARLSFGAKSAKASTSCDSNDGHEDRLADIADTI